MSEDRYYAVRMLWVRDQQAWDKYQEIAKPILARHGVQVEHWLVTEDIFGEGFDRPDLIVVTSDSSAAALEAFERDLDFKNPAGLRGADLVTVTARSGMPPTSG